MARYGLEISHTLLPDELVDEGVQYTDLTDFQRDVLLVIRLITAEPDTDVSGANIQDRIEAQYGEGINHSRLYQNLQTLVDHGLVTTTEIDGRTKEYSLTASARGLLSEQSDRLEAALDDQAEDREVMADGGREVATFPVSSTDRPVVSYGPTIVDR